MDLTKIRAWVNEHEHLCGLLCLVVLCGLAYAAGRFSAPDKVKVVTVHEKKTHDQATQVAAKTETHQQTQQSTKVQMKIIYKDRIVHVDGTIEEKSVEEHVDQATQVQIDLRSAAQLAAQSVVHDTITTTMQSKEVDRDRPAWEVGLMGGLLLDAHGVRPFGGLEGAHRFIGPVKVGGWVMGSPASATNPKPAIMVGGTVKIVF